MSYILVFLVVCILAPSYASIPNNKRGGHGLFHGLDEEPGKSSWLEEPKSKLEDAQIEPKHRTNADNSVSISLVPEKKNSLLDNSDAKLKTSSLFLQPEPRGLQYMMNSHDYNPYLINYFKKRDVSNIDKSICGTLNIVQCLHRNKRQINLLPGNVIPGSRGQAVLYGVPGSNGGSFPGGNQGIPNTNTNFGVPQGPFQNGPNNFEYAQPRGQSEVGNQGLYNAQHQGGYKTHGY